LALRHPDPLVEAVRFAIYEGELLQAVGRGRGVRRNAETRLEVLILTDVPLPIPVDILITWKGLCDAGPLDVLAANGVIPLDYMGIVAALPGRFENETQLKDWFQKRPEARSKLKAVKRTARDLGTVDLCEFSDISHRESNMGKVAKLAAYRYRRAGSGQGSLVLVNGAMHADAQAAVEAMPRYSFRRRSTSAATTSSAEGVVDGRGQPVRI
jgi:hypothetical protein